MDEADRHVGSGSGSGADMLAAVIAAGLPLASFAPERRSLQDIYLARMKAVAERPPLRLVGPTMSLGSSIRSSSEFCGCISAGNG